MDDTPERMIKDSRHVLKPLFPPPKEDDLSSPQYRLGIGILGFLLPFLLILTAGVRPTEGLSPWERLDSVSAYYYTEGMFYFVGILLALGVFLVMYRGYGNKHNLLDRYAVIIAGIAATGVAIFSCRPPHGITNSGWVPWMGVIHYSCAAVMFFAFIFISFFLFTKSKVKKDDRFFSGTRIRKFFYRLFGLLMFVCMVLIGIRAYNDKSIFLPEALAVLFFATSWLVKGRADWTLASAGKLAVHYVSHPGRLVSKVRDVNRG
jgi:hypothetical protein